MNVADTPLIDRKGVSLNQEAFTDLGFLFREQSILDYGIDAHVEMVESGTATGQLFGLQIKTGKSYFEEETDAGFVFRGKSDHFSYWLNHSLPVVLTLCEPDDRSVYWQVITENTVESTGIGWKVVVPHDQLVNRDSLEKLKQVSARVVPTHRYTVLRQEDVSWAGAKRYSLDILLNRTLTKAEIAQVIRQVVIEHIGSRYYRDDIVESHWGESDAHVIFLFVYLTLDDQRHANWICRSLWIDPFLAEDSAPSPLRGENIGGSIVTEWSENQSRFAHFYRAHTLAKADYLRSVTSLLDRLCPLVSRIIEAVDHEWASKGYSADEVFVELEAQISEIYADGTSIGFPPVECRDIDLKLQNVLATAHNLVLPFCDFSADRSRKPSVERLMIDDYKMELEHLHYEMKKVR